MTIAVQADDARAPPNQPATDSSPASDALVHPLPQANVYRLLVGGGPTRHPLGADDGLMSAEAAVQRVTGASLADICLVRGAHALHQILCRLSVAELERLGALSDDEEMLTWAVRSSSMGHKG